MTTAAENAATWQELLAQLNAEYRDLGEDNPAFHVYDLAGNRLRVVEIYNEDGVLCMDVAR